MSAKPRILLVCDAQEDAERTFTDAVDSHEVMVVRDPLRALALLAREKFAGVYVTSEYLKEAIQVGKLLQNEQILEGMPDGVVLLDGDNTILWDNGRLCEWSDRESVVGSNFYSMLGGPEILGPDFCPFHTALATGQGTVSTLRSEDNRYYHVHSAPVRVFPPPRPEGISQPNQSPGGAN